MESADPAPPTPAPKPDLSLEELQKEKARLEIRDLRRWWLRPTGISAASTIILGVLAFVSAVWIGYFDKAKLDYERAKLATAVESMKAEKGKLEGRVAELQTEALKLQTNVLALGADKTVSVSIAERRVADSESAFRTCLQGNQSLAKSNESWQDHAKKQEEAIVGLRNSLADTKARQERAERIASGLRKQLSLYPPLVREARLSYSTYDHELSGEINGANFGADRGTVELRAVKRFGTPPKPSVPLTEAIVLTADSVTKWSTSSIEYSLSPGSRSRLAQAVKQKLSGLGDADWPDLLHSQELNYEVRVTTSSETHSEWSVLAKGMSWSTGPVRAGLPPDEAEIK